MTTSAKTRQVIVDLPSEYEGSALLVDTWHEEDALCWLWAFSEVFTG